MAKDKKEVRYQDLSVEELSRKLEKTNQDLFKARFRIASASLKNTMQIRTYKREIARLNTFISQRKSA